MSKGQPNPPLLFAGALALGVALFFGGYALRGDTDAVARVTREPSPFGGEDLLASRSPQATAISLGDFYVAMTDLLKREYVEPIKDDQKLATGAVRGMVLSLGDPRSSFMDKDEFRAFLNAREGRYEGIGAEFELRGSTTAPKRVEPGTDEPVDDPREAALAGHVPYLVVTMVVPGGPAARAGVQPGDVVSYIDGHWVVDDAEIDRFNKARAAFARKQIPFATIAKIQQSLKAKVERSLMPAKAKDRLFLGTTGAVNVVWTRNGVARSTKIAKGPSAVSPFGVQAGAITLRFDVQAPARLRSAIKDRSSVTLDLRNNVDGDFDSMRKSLAILAPTGGYGALSSRRKQASARFAVVDGNPHPPKLTIRVDRTTRGPAAIFAEALASRHLATLVGGPVGSDHAVKEVVALPDGTGYTLVTGEYRPSEAPTKVALAETQPGVIRP